MMPPVKNCKWLYYPLGDISQWFGENKPLYKQTMGWDGGHNGVDIVRPHGEHMFAVEDGIVCAVKEDAGGHGKHIRLVSLATDERGYHRDWVYGHMSFIGVKNGQEVKAGQFVGTMGNTGFVVSGNTPFWENNPYAGTHLHLGVRWLKPVKRGGWKYEGHPTMWESIDYDNGTKGRIDPLPFFINQNLKSAKVLALASKLQDKMLYNLSEILRAVGV